MKIGGSFLKENTNLVCLIIDIYFGIFKILCIFWTKSYFYSFNVFATRFQWIPYTKIGLPFLKENTNLVCLIIDISFGIFKILCIFWTKSYFDSFNVFATRFQRIPYMKIRLLFLKENTNLVCL